MSKEMLTNPGADITMTAANAIAKAKVEDTDVHFTLAGITVNVTKASKADLISRDWERAVCGCMGDSPTVGPHPKPTLSPDEIAADKVIIDRRNRGPSALEGDHDL